MARVNYSESVMNSIMGSTANTVEIKAEYDEYSHSSKFTDGILLCESHDVSMLRIGKEADRIQEELEGKVSDMEMFAEATFGEKGFFKGVWDFVVKCFTAVVDWVKSIFGKFVKVTEKTVKELEKASNEFKLKSDKLKDKNLAFTENARVTFFKIPTSVKTPELNTFIAHNTLSLGINTLWEVSKLKEFKFGTKTAKNLFETEIGDTLRKAVQSSADKLETAAGGKDTPFGGALNAVKAAVDTIMNNQNTTGGFGSENKERKLKYFLNGLLDNDDVFGSVKSFRLTPGEGSDNSKMGAKEEFVKTFFDYQEHQYNGKDCATFITGLKTINNDSVTVTLGDMATVKNKLSEGSKYFENIKKEYEKISAGFVSAAKSMSTSTGKEQEGARANASQMSGFLDNVSKLTSWYTSNVINTYAIADLCIGKSASNLIGALNLGVQTIDGVATTDK